MNACFRSVTGGYDWGVYYDVLAPTGLANCVIFLFFVIFSQIALLNIVTGIFVENAMKLGQPEVDHLAFAQRKQDLEDAAELRKVFRQIDTDGSGTLTAQEFAEAVQNERFRAQLAVLGLDIKDAEKFFRVVTDLGVVDMEFFVDGCLRLKGSASNIDLQTLALETKLVQQSLVTLTQQTQSIFSELCYGFASLDRSATSPLPAHSSELFRL
mmetsp:Transcript_16933/g.34340  ORF Transcript_16933/g.34340 Transcript_16933/m.34340 type:complete len:212 (-) Transcript_16933:2-637(-)